MKLSPLSPRARRTLLPVLLAVSLLHTNTASAQRARRAAVAAAPDATERARELFEQGIAALQRESWEEARGLFEQAFAIAPRPSILVNLATAQRQTGQLIEARNSYRLFLERFATHELAPQARTAQSEVESLMPHVTIHVEQGEPGDVVFLDGVEITTLDRPFEANPGLREVSLRRGEVTLQSVRVRVELEGHEEVFLRGIDLTPSVVAQQATEVAPPVAMTPRSDDTPLIVGVTIASVVVVAGAVVLGVLFGTQEQTAARATTSPTIRAGVVTFE
jgi:hypothetical protein